MVPHSKAWVSAIPVSKLGLLLPDKAMCTPIQQPHRCCGAIGDRLDHHNLLCQRDPGRLPRHAALSNVLHWALAAAGVVVVLESRGLDCSNEHQPDDITIFPLCRGRMLVWDATCVNTFSGLHLLECATSASAVACVAEDCKRHQSTDLTKQYDFMPLVVETIVVLGAAFSNLLNEIGRQISEWAGEMHETPWLRQCISLAVVHGIAAALCQL